ncbi:MAG: hypothetical protein Q7J32_15960, partial [Sphingomonadaceae bacterium]|nr:hypothetical protein [Sphingomonadaceae bacterium]
ATPVATPRAASRLTLAPGPFVAAALAGLVASGRLGRRDPIARHLAGIEAFRPGDGAPLTVADLDAHAHDVDRFLATQLIESVTGQSLATHLAQAVLGPLGMREARIVGSPCIRAVECSAEDARRWRRSGLQRPSIDRDIVRKAVG